MAKLTVNANELQNVSVNFVSLVKRGANRIPFRVMKSEGDVAFDLGSFFVRKADADEAERVSARKSEDVLKAAMAVIAAAGHTVTLKSEPASDGGGTSDTKNPAEGTDAGGKRNDGTSADGTGAKNPAAGAEAGGPRNDGTGTSTVVAKEDDSTVTVEKTETVTKTETVAKAAADEEDEDDADEEDGEEEGKKAPPFVKKGAKAKKADAVEKTEAVVKTGEDMIREMFAKQEQALAELARTVTGRFDSLTTRFDLVDGRLQKTEGAVADTGRRMSALVPNQAAPDAETRVTKTDKYIPPLDTAYGSLD